MIKNVFKFTRTRTVTRDSRVLTGGRGLAITVAAVATALALSATTAIINPLEAYADWPKTVTYAAVTDDGDIVSQQTTCDSPQICKEFLDANPNQHAKSNCQEVSDEFEGGEKCKKVDEIPIPT
jgi:hypothetical protein